MQLKKYNYTQCYLKLLTRRDIYIHDYTNSQLDHFEGHDIILTSPEIYGYISSKTLRSLLQRKVIEEISSHDLFTIYAPI